MSNCNNIENIVSQFLAWIIQSLPSKVFQKCLDKYYIKSRSEKNIYDVKKLKTIIFKKKILKKRIQVYSKIKIDD